MQLNRRSIFTLIMLLAFIIQIPCSLRAQRDVVGTYRLSNTSLELKPDSTFSFSWGVCLTQRWSSGTWQIKNDTIYFKVIPIYDTVTYSDERIEVKHGFLSEYGESGNVHFPISSYHFIEPIRFSTQEQNHFPTALFFKKNKLFAIAEDKRIIRKKTRMSFLKKGYPTWYTKVVKKT